MKTELKTYSPKCNYCTLKSLRQKNSSYLESFRKQTDLGNILVDSHRYLKSVCFLKDNLGMYSEPIQPSKIENFTEIVNNFQLFQFCNSIPKKLDSGHIAWKLGLWTPGRLGSRRLDSGHVNAWTLEAWTLWLWSRGLWTPRHLDSGRLDSGQLDAWTLETWTLDYWTHWFWMRRLLTLWRLDPGRLDAWLALYNYKFDFFLL